MSHVYQDNYYDYIDGGSIRSARAVIPTARRYVNINSVLDVGCGRGAWLKGWVESGIDDFVGVDGDYVQVDKLPFSPDHFHAVDLVKRFDLGRTFDLVQCLEVAEHVPAYAADILVDSIVGHGNSVLFSAAVPGQGGEFHVNEQGIDFWVQKFEARGFTGWDVIRPALRDVRSIEPWYRYNSVLFTRVRPAEVEDCDRFPASGYRVPITWRLRNSVIGMLPYPVVGRLARAKHAAMRTMRAL
ncbi:MAG: methyltransferase domain-containing protein [Devosia nanyangense]|uniref:Methyltransferase domain-containing protein n=1 Tax=Devosia nanyangense TaxID=1228055 RepID=A0A933L0Z2_9HYPH|nr:methyltransferase domain-containing protein [Devosia nanyangense]